MNKQTQWLVIIAGIIFVALGFLLIREPETKPARALARPSLAPNQELPPSDTKLTMAPKPSATRNVREVRKGCPDARRIVLIGDSYGEGIGPHLKHPMLACGVEYSFYAKRGTSATQWVREDWIGPVLKEDPDVVMVSLGGNDFLRQDADVIREAVNGIVARVRRSGARLFWMEPLSLPYPDKAGVREMWRKATGDDWFRSEHLHYGRAPDRIHISYDNYRDWAQKIWPWLICKMRKAKGPEDLKPCS